MNAALNVSPTEGMNMKMSYYEREPELEFMNQSDSVSMIVCVNMMVNVSKWEC